MAYVSYVRRGGVARYLAIVALFVAGLLAKPVVALAPFTWLLLDLWRRSAEARERLTGGS